MDPRKPDPAYASPSSAHEDPEPTLLNQARRLVHRLTHAVGYGVGGAVIGAVAGFFVHSAPKTRKPTEQDEVDRLTSNVRTMQLLRTMMPALQQQFTELEYSNRRKLEAMGYYPCSRCGKPHKGGGPDAGCMPKGTYYDEEQKKYVEPDDEEWSAENYEKATGQKWDPGPLGDDEGDGEGDGDDDGDSLH